MSLERVHGLVGWTVQQARLDWLSGSSITIELGGCVVLVNDAAWRIEDEEEFLVASGDDRDYIRGMITELDGRTLTAVTVSKFLDLTMDFEGLRLITFALPANDHHWSVQFEDDTVFFAGPSAGGTGSSHQPT